MIDTNAIAIAAIHGFAYGQVLSFGSLIQGFQDQYNATYSSAVLLGDIQFGTFYAAGVLAWAIDRFLSACLPQKWWKNKIAFTIFFVIWVVGASLAAFSTDWTTFFVTHATLTALGNGIMFWASAAHILHPEVTVRSIIIHPVFFWASLAPNMYQTVAAGVVPIMGNGNYFTYVVLVGGGSVLLFAPWFITSVDDDGDRIVKERHEHHTAEDTGTVIELLEKDALYWGPFVTFLVSVGLFQFVFFVPPLIVPDLMRTNIPGIGEHEISLVMVLLGVGSVVGRFSGTVIDTFDTKENRTLFTILFATFSSLVLACFASAGSFSSMAAVSFFYGFFSSLYVRNVTFTILEWWNTDTYEEPSWQRTKLALFCLACVPGSYSSGTTALAIKNASGYPTVFLYASLLGMTSAVVMFFGTVAYRELTKIKGGQFDLEDPNEWAGYNENTETDDRVWYIKNRFYDGMNHDFESRKGDLRLHRNLMSHLDKKHRVARGGREIEVEDERKGGRLSKVSEEDDE